jgi:hypothetical protein
MIPRLIRGEEEHGGDEERVGGGGAGQWVGRASSGCKWMKMLTGKG